MPLNLFYTMVQKSEKWPKLKSRGGVPALKVADVANAVRSVLPIRQDGFIARQ